MNKIKTRINKDFTVQIPQQAINDMKLVEGDFVLFEYESQRIADKCIVIKEDVESKIEKDEYFCIPLQLFKYAGLANQDLQVILGDEELTVTTSSNIINALPPEFIEALMEQGVDFNRIADCVAERINDNVLESEEEPV